MTEPTRLWLVAHLEYLLDATVLGFFGIVITAYRWAVSRKR